MTWDSVTLESPSFNAVNAGTMLRLPTSKWTHQVLDANPEQKAQGDDKAPVKADAGMYIEQFTVIGEISQKSATDLTIWNSTIINGASRTALNNAEELRDLLLASKKTWYKETVSGNWHNDGTPARAKGLCRLRLGDKWNGAALVPYYTYGFVINVTIGEVHSSMKESKTMPYRIDFGYAHVQSV